MSRKDYEALAAAISTTKDETREILGSFSVLKRTTERVADVLAADNPSFDRGRFMLAAGFYPDDRQARTVDAAAEGV